MTNADATVSPVVDPRPSHARFTLLGVLCTLTAILYLDRVCIAQALKPIRNELGLSNTQMGYVLAAFTLAYGLFELPTGYLGDRLGARRVLTRIAVWWSLFTILTGACWNLGSLLVVRFLFGAGEAGAYPNAARVITRWYPPHERGRVPGVLNFTALLGATATPVVAQTLIQWIGWRPSFLVFGLTGIVWAVGFRHWYRDDPSSHPGVNAAELAWIGGGGGGAAVEKPVHGPIPWRAVFATATIGWLGLSMTCSSFNSYLYFSWLPTYLQEGRGVSARESGWLASGVLAGGACGMLAGGYVVDLVCGRGPRLVARRRILAVSALIVAAALLLVAIVAESPRASAAAIALSFLSASMINVLWWVSATEVSGKHVGALFGLMNSMGIFGAMGSQLFFGRFSDWRKAAGHIGRAQWDPALYIYCGVLLLGALCWFKIDPTVTVDDHEARLRCLTDPPTS